MALNTAIIQTFVVNGTIMVIFLILGGKVIARSKSRLSFTLAAFFLVDALGLFINVLYRILDDYYWNIILNKVTIYLTSLGIINLLTFNYLLLKSEKAFSLKKQLIITAIYAALLAVLFVIPNGVEWAYKIDENGTLQMGYNGFLNRYDGDVGVPVWSWTFALYGLILTQILFIFIIRSAIQLYFSISDPLYKKKYISNIIGILCFDLVLAGNYVFNALNQYRIILTLISIAIIPGVFLVYFGLRKEEK